MQTYYGHAHSPCVENINSIFCASETRAGICVCIRRLGWAGSTIENINNNDLYSNELSAINKKIIICNARL